MRILVTGVDGLLGTHVRALLHSKNAAALFNSKARPYEIVTMNRVQFSDESISSQLVANVEVVIHCAGVNRGTDDEVGKGNQQIAETLVARLTAASATPHVVYLNSTHSSLDSIYGIGKKETSVIFSTWAEKNSAQYTDLVLPHIFGEGGKPFYNTVTATLCKQIIDGEKPVINPQGKVELLHAGDAAEIALECGLANQGGSRRAAGQEISIPALHGQLSELYNGYINGVMPALVSKLEVQLFNTLRAFLFPGFYPKELVTHSDNRGLLFEAVKGGSGQTFLSWTKPGITRGDHFHLQKVERFLVVRGSAIIRLRHIFSSQIHEYRVNGDIPSYVDMPTMYTHSIENTGDEPLLTMFWAHEIFDPKNPDTYADKVLDS